MPNQSFLYTGRVHACSQLHNMSHLARELCGGQICVTPDSSDFQNADTQPWLEKFYSLMINGLQMIVDVFLLLEEIF